MPKEEKQSLPTFVKWAGGKGQLIEQFEDLFPKKIDRYIEPFVGSGAIFFHIKKNFKPKQSVICDSNKELITTYKIIKKEVTKLAKELRKHEKGYHKEKKDYYLSVRANEPNDPVKIAARFIFLNRTCWNGLHRVNLSGKFNVPMGNYANRAIVREDILKDASKQLKGTKIINGDFEKIKKEAKKGDFIYFDPPYDQLPGKSSFTTYQKDKFLKEEQERLKDLFDYLTKKKCKCMLSNSDTPFINKLYSKYNIKKVYAKRMINSDASKRGAIKEVVVRNY